MIKLKLILEEKIYAKEKYPSLTFIYDAREKKLYTSENHSIQALPAMHPELEKSLDWLNQGKYFNETKYRDGYVGGKIFKNEKVITFTWKPRLREFDLIIQNMESDLQLSISDNWKIECYIDENMDVMYDWVVDKYLMRAIKKGDIKVQLKPISEYKKYLEKVRFTDVVKRPYKSPTPWR